MFGEDGWCRACGTPLSVQVGSLVLQRKGLQAARGAWMPNWRFDALCVSASLAAEIGARFSVPMLPIQWPRGAPAPAYQLLARATKTSWFDAEQLSAAAHARHGTDGARCHTCNTWRWMPLDFRALPALRVISEDFQEDIAASPEWFGDGCQSFRQILVRRDLGELLVRASPRDFGLCDPDLSERLA
jgi:hypothetical protein